MFERPTSEVARGKSGRFCSKSCVNFARDYRRRAPEERFWARVTKTDACWLWNGYRTDNGYGQFGQSNIPGDNEYAHRYSYRLAHGAIPDGLLVLHRCDVRHCVNPDHLYTGTPKQNTADMDGRGRRGDSSPLPEDLVRAIRADAANGDSLKTIALRHGVSMTAVASIRSGRTRRKVA